MTNLNEQWKDIKGFEGCYQISSLGRIKSLERQDSKGRLRKERILSQNKKDDKGYHTANLYKDGKNQYKRVHILVAEAFIPNPNNKPEVNHIDGNKSNNSVSNLEWNTTKENCEHRQRMGLGDTKSANNARKIKVESYDLKTGKTIKQYECAADAAREFGVKNDAISSVVRGDKKSFRGLGFRKSK